MLWPVPSVLDMQLKLQAMRCSFKPVIYMQLYDALHPHLSFVTESKLGK